MASSGSARPPQAPTTSLKYLLLTLHLPSISMGLGLGLTVPVIPELTQQMGVDLEGAALVFVFQLLGTFAAPLPTGFLIDKLGRRRVLLAGPIITAAASLLVAKVALDGADGSYVELLIYRFIAGWGEQMWMMSRITVIADTGATNQRGKQVTQMFGVQQIGNLSGPVAGGFAAVLLGLWTPFVMHAAIVLVALIPSFYLLRETAPPARSPQASASGEPVRGVWRHMASAPIPAVFVVQFLANVTRGGVFGGGVIVVYAAYTYGLEPDELGVLRGTMAAVAIPIVFTGGYVMDRFGRKYTIVPGLILSALRWCSSPRSRIRMLPTRGSLQGSLPYTCPRISSPATCRRSGRTSPPPRLAASSSACPAPWPRAVWCSAPRASVGSTRCSALLWDSVS